MSQPLKIVGFVVKPHSFGRNRFGHATENLGGTISFWRTDNQAKLGGLSKRASSCLRTVRWGLASHTTWLLTRKAYRDQPSSPRVRLFALVALRYLRLVEISNSLLYNIPAGCPLEDSHTIAAAYHLFRGHWQAGNGRELRMDDGWRPRIESQDKNRCRWQFGSSRGKFRSEIF